MNKINGLNKVKENVKHYKKYKLKGIIISATVLVIIAIMCSVYIQKTYEPEYTDSTFSTAIDKNATDDNKERSVDEVKTELNNKVKDGIINVSISKNTVFENGKSLGKLDIFNTLDNELPQVVEIYLKNTDTKIYTSKLIPLGKTIHEAKLDKILDKGVYQCIAYFNAVDSNTGVSNGKAASEITIEILD